MHVINLHKICTIFHSQPLEYDNDNEHDDDDDVDGGPEEESSWGEGE